MRLSMLYSASPFKKKAFRNQELNLLISDPLKKPEKPDIYHKGRSILGRKKTYV